MGLFRAADAEDVAAVGEGIGFDGRVLARGPQEPGGPAAGRAGHQSLSAECQPAGAAASSRTSVFLQKAKRSRLRVRSRALGVAEDGDRDGGHAHERRKPPGQVHGVADPQRGGVHVDEVRPLRGEDVQARGAQALAEDVPLVLQGGGNALVEGVGQGQARRRWRTGTACPNCR